MAVFRPSARKWRRRQFPTKPDALAFTRRLVQAAKLRSRRPVTVPSISRIWPEDGASPQDIALHSAAPLRPSPFPCVPEEPLVAPANWRDLPKTLAKPEFPEIKPEFVAAAQPEYEGLSPRYIRSSWAHIGYKAMGIYRKLYLDPPKTGLPEGYNLILTDSGLATGATHIFGVYPYPSSETPDPAARRRACPSLRREVCLYPTHAVIWAAYCSKLPMIPMKPTKLKVFLDPRPGARRASVLRLPIVPIAMPYPPTFFIVMQFVYNFRKSSFVNMVLPCAGYGLPQDHLVDPPTEVTMPLYAEALAKEYDLPHLCRLAKNVHGTYQNMVALGVVENRMWDALKYAWETVLAAMECAEKANLKEVEL
ncbi:hypothetical protein C8Q78DRAFT_1077909 [Trametes maxima]|nr:hypothetical protein C8Q78DRAFT_1077909 [Trametes maxima]